MKKNLIILVVLSLMASCSLNGGGNNGSNTTSGAVAVYDAENPFNTNVNPSSGCSSTTWVNLSTPAEIATINCSSGGGFAGAGIFTNPYRMEFSGSTYVATSLNVQPAKYPESTWIAWVNPTSTSLQHILSIDNHAGAFNRALVISNSNWGVFNGSTTFEATAADLNSWQQIAVVFTASGITLYKNGTAFPMGSAPVVTNTTQTLTIGRSAGGAFDYFQGAVAWVGIYPRALTSSEIGTACRNLATRFSAVVCN